RRGARPVAEATRAELHRERRGAGHHHGHVRRARGGRIRRERSPEVLRIHCRVLHGDPEAGAGEVGCEDGPERDLRRARLHGVRRCAAPRCSRDLDHLPRRLAVAGDQERDPGCDPGRGDRHGRAHEPGIDSPADEWRGTRRAHDGPIGGGCMRKPTPLVEIVSTGRYLPERVMTNEDLERLVDTSDEWIRERTGIRERRIACGEMGAAEMGAAAARIAMERADVKPGELDLIVVSTATPDRLLPSTACDVQALLGASNAAAFDIDAACSGFLYALSVAEGYLAAGRGEIALVVSTEKMSAIVDWTDRSTCVLFGDGAGAAVVKRSENGRGVVSSFM